MPKYTRDGIWAKIQQDDKWAQRAILALYDHQTEDERMVGETHHNNRVGFNAFDAEFMTSLAIQLERYGSLSPKQLAAARKVLKKYCGQLVRIANAR
jgi:hypothetical protein